MKFIKIFLPGMSLLLMSSSSLAQNADSANYYQKQAAQNYQAKDYQKAAQGYISALSHYSDNATAAFNAACCFSLLNNKKEALKWLERAVDLGFYKFDEDTDLDNLRNSGQYIKILTRARKLDAELKNKMDNPVIGLPQELDSTKSYGLLVALHGYGSDPNNIVQALGGVPQRMGYILVAPYGVKPMGNGGFNWDNWDQAEQKVLNAVRQARGKYRIDPSRIILLGFSQGGIYTYYIGAKNASLFKGIIPMAGSYYSEVDQFLPRSRENGLKICIMFGGDEPEPLIKSNLDAYRSFIMSGITASLTVCAGLGHAMPPNKEFEIQRAIEWVEKH